MEFIKGALLVGLQRYVLFPSYCRDYWASLIMFRGGAGGDSDRKGNNGDGIADLCEKRELWKRKSDSLPYMLVTCHKSHTQYSIVRTVPMRTNMTLRVQISIQLVEARC